LSTILLWLGPINIALALFNMAPGFPLDGGRVFRAILWWATDDLRRSTQWATGLGRVFGLVLVGAGILMIFGIRLPVLGAGLLPGLWLVLIGWFLRNAAQGSYRQLELRRSLTQLSVEELMRSQIRTIPADASVAEFIEDYVFESDQRTFPVVEGDRLIGIATAVDAKAVLPASRERTQVQAIMSPLEDIHTLAPEDDAAGALRYVARFGDVPVVEQGHILGLLGDSDVRKWMMLGQPRASS
jgi:CBS domain-containing protein